MRTPGWVHRAALASVAQTTGVSLASAMAWILVATAPVAAEPPEGGEAVGTAAPATPEIDRELLRRRARELTRRQGERRPDDQLTVELFERPLTIGGEFELRSRFRGDYRLDPERDDDDLNQEAKLEIELFYPVTRSVSLFLEGKIGYEADLYSEDGVKESEWKPQRGEMWLHYQDIAESGFSLQVGRQSFKDKREWWWDSNLDAIRLFYEFHNFEIQLAAAQELGPIQANHDHVVAELEDVFFALGQGTWHWGRKNRIELFAAHRHDHSGTHRIGDIVHVDREDRFDGDLSWLGLRALGRVKVRPLGRFHYWLDLAAVRGRETELGFDDLKRDPDYSEVEERIERDVRGWAVDGGVTWDPRRPWWPRLTLGYAIGSGDRRLEGGRDDSFRQTGLQDNNGKFRGVDRFKYYGELFRPELSNLHVLTASLGFPILDASSIELVYHRYRQDEALPYIRASKLKARPTGDSRALGQELDLVIGLEEWTHWELELVGAVFRAGRGYGAKEGEYAYLALFKVDYNF